jgi:hypothetical protein
MKSEILIMSIEKPTLAHFRHFSSLYTNFPSTTVENVRQITPFYAKQSQFCAFFARKRRFHQKTNPIQTQLKPIQTQFKPNKAKNKPNSNPIFAKNRHLFGLDIGKINICGVKMESRCHLKIRIWPVFYIGESPIPKYNIG